MLSPRCYVQALTCSIIFYAGVAQAAAPRLHLNNNTGCEIGPRELSEKVARSVAGEANPEIIVGVEIDAASHDLRSEITAFLRLRTASELIGTRQLEAPTCREIEGALVAVIALALSSTADRSIELELQTDLSADNEFARPALSPSMRTPTSRLGEDNDERVSTASESRNWALGVAFGLDEGTAARSGELLSLNVARRLPTGELRLSTTYGLAFQEETASIDGEATTEEQDFMALSASYCQHLGFANWIAPCAGLELGVERFETQRTDAQQGVSIANGTHLGLGASLGVLVAYRDAPIRPELALSGQLPLFSEAYAEPIAVRGSVGVAVPF